jgi:hypothetical protein
VPTLDRSQLVLATITTVAKNLAEGAALVAIILFALLGNWRAALIATLVIPLSLLISAIGMNAQHFRQSDEPGRAGLWPDHRWRGDHCRKQPAPSGRAAGP